MLNLILREIAYSVDKHLFKTSQKDTTSTYLGVALLSSLFILNFVDKLFYTFNISNVVKEIVFCLN